ncbi:hypothetical protein [Paraflavitalea speifideaquila]|uniref:hypothetical protein n=1 Tax=Paraflavitalea speifideaquila TaxID=3076558 RepID=UPI0028EF7632|nr:hypothetical protein [Paraflavitalea speifideiaquila]
MKRKTTFLAIGGYQPFFFCIGMYCVALFFSIFICSAIFHVLNPKISIVRKNDTPVQKTATAASSKQVLLTVTK